MKIHIQQLWKIPVYCAAAGYIGFYLLVYGISSFAVERLPDGTVTTNDTLSLLFSFLLLLLTLAVGFFLFRKTQKQDLFWSATLTVAVQLILQAFSVHGGNISATWIHAFATEWSRFLSHGGYLITGAGWDSVLLSSLAPYLFVFFGAKNEE